MAKQPLNPEDTDRDKSASGLPSYKNIASGQKRLHTPSPVTMGLMGNFRPTAYARPGAKDRPTAISDVLGRSFDRLGIAQRIKEYKIFTAWTEAVGKAIAKRTFPKRLMGTKLYINVSSQAWMTELMYQKSTIMEKIAEIIGPGTVTEIVFSPGPVSTKPVKKESSAVVKARLARLKLTEEQKRFIEDETAKIHDATLKGLVEKLMVASLKA